MSKFFLDHFTKEPAAITEDEIKQYFLYLKYKKKLSGSASNSDTGKIKYVAILISLEQLEKRIAELEKYKDREIIVYCRSGIRSLSGTRLLLKYGYNAFNLLGGIIAWNKLLEK